jgi:hypothetical protein
LNHVSFQTTRDIGCLLTPAASVVIDQHLFELLLDAEGVGGVRSSPLGTFNEMGDDDPEATFGRVAGKINGGALAYLHIVNPAIAAIEKGIEPDLGALRMLG